MRRARSWRQAKGFFLGMRGRGLFLRCWGVGVGEGAFERFGRMTGDGGEVSKKWPAEPQRWTGEIAVKETGPEMVGAGQASVVVAGLDVGDVHGRDHRRLLVGF